MNNSMSLPICFSRAILKKIRKNQSKKKLLIIMVKFLLQDSLIFFKTKIFRFLMIVYLEVLLNLRVNQVITRL